MIDDGIFAGLTLFAAIFLLPLFSHELSKSIRILLAYWFVIGLHQLVVFTNTFFFTTFGADGDANDFHRIGVELSGAGDWIFSVGSGFYAQTLGVAYSLFGTSHLFGQQLSILSFALSCVILLKVLSVLRLSSYRVPVLLCFGALPTMALLGSVTLRESYQILFFMLAVYCGLQCQMSGKLRFLAGAVISALVMGLFHNGLILYAGFLIALVMVWRLRPASSFWRVSKLRLLAIVIIPFGFFGILTILNALPDISGAALKSAATGDLLDYAALYREQSDTTRATYGVMLDTSSWGAFVPSSLAVLFYYLFAPFPWQIGGLIDVYAFMESLWRMALIFYAIREWRSTRGPLKKVLGFMLALYFSMAFLWAAGTTNYGTAIRHHMVHYWIIVVLGLPPLVDAVKKIEWQIIKGGRLKNKRPLVCEDI